MNSIRINAIIISAIENADKICLDLNSKTHDTEFNSLQDILQEKQDMGKLNKNDAVALEALNEIAKRESNDNTWPEDKDKITKPDVSQVQRDINRELREERMYEDWDEEQLDKFNGY